METPPAPIDPYDLGREGLHALLEELGEPAYRARQVHRWLVRGVDDPHRMTDLPKGLRGALAERFAPTRPRLVRHRAVEGGTTHKLLVAFPDGSDPRSTMVETVVMLYPEASSPRATVCVSSQAGCAMGCPFCATGQAGLDRQLTAGEIVRQVVLADAFLAEHDELDGPDHVTNVVYMGMGEPLANIDGTERSLTWLTDAEGFNLSARSITVSTVGLVPGIRRLTDLGLPVTLAVSLHAADDDLRDELVPPNRMHPIVEVLDAAGDYRRTTGRRVSFEYILIDGVNDSDEQAAALAGLLRGDGRGVDDRPITGRHGDSHVNLIPMNPTPGVPEWRQPPPRRIASFVEVLRDRGITATVRDTKGRDADAACGQLLATYRLGQGSRLPVAVGAAERVDARRQEQPRTAST